MERWDWRQKLREAMDERGLNMKSLSKAAKLGDTYVRDLLEREREPTISNARKLCSALGRSMGSIFGPGWIDSAEDSPETEPPNRALPSIVDVQGTEFARLPVYQVRFAAGAGSVHHSEQPVDFYLVSLSMLRSLSRSPIEAMGVFQVDGDSMEPTINNRDWVLVDTMRKNLREPGIYCLNVDGRGLVKRAAQHLESGVVTLISDNRKYPVEKIRRAETLIVVGRVRLSIRRH